MTREPVYVWACIRRPRVGRWLHAAARGWRRRLFTELRVLGLIDVEWRDERPQRRRRGRPRR